jgi:hypothetical protein
VFAGLVVEVAELGVAVGVLAALDGLGVGLQGKALFPEPVKIVVYEITLLD